MSSRKRNLNDILIGSRAPLQMSAADQMLARFAPTNRELALNALSDIASANNLPSTVPRGQYKRANTTSAMEIALMKAKAASGQAQGSSALTEVLKARNLPEWVTKVKGFDINTGTMEDVERILVENPNLITNKDEDMLDFVRSKGYVPEMGNLSDSDAARIRKERTFERGTKQVAKLTKADKTEYSREEAVKKLNEGFHEGSGSGQQFRGKEDGQSGFYTKNLGGGVSFIPDNSQAEKVVFGASGEGEKRIRELASKYGRLDFMFDKDRRNTIEFEAMMMGRDPNEGGFGRGLEFAARDVGRVLDTEIIPGFSLSDIPIIGQAVRSFTSAAEQAGKGIGGQEVDWKKFYKDAAGAAGTFVPGLSEIVDIGLGFAEAHETGDVMAAVQNAGRGIMAGLDRSGVGGEFKQLVGDLISDNLQDFGGKALDMIKSQGIDPTTILESVKGGLDSKLDASFDAIAQGAAQASKGLIGDVTGQFADLPGKEIFTEFVSDVKNRIDPKKLVTDAAKSYGKQALEGNFDPTNQLKQIGNNLAGAVQSSAEKQLESVGKNVLDQVKANLDPSQLLSMLKP